MKTQLEIFQNALTNSVEDLLNAEARVQSHLKWLIDAKCSTLFKAAIGRIFNSDDICSYNDYDNKGFEHDVAVRVASVYGHKVTQDIVSELKWCDERKYPYNDILCRIYVVFMRDPVEILTSKVKPTDVERKLLNEMYFYGFVQNDGERIMTLNNKLKDLKHKYNIAFSVSWPYSLEDVLRDNFLEIGLSINGKTIVPSNSK